MGVLGAPDGGGVRHPDRIAELEARLAASQRRVREQADALLESETRYRALFEHSPDMIVMVDGEGVVREANRTALRRLSQPAQSVVGRQFNGLFLDGFGLDGERIHSVERQLRLADGRVVQLRAAPVPGTPPMMQVVLRDVTTRQQVEEELERTRRLAAVGHLAAGVAHEINNPLTVMQLRIDLLREQELAQPLRDQLAVVREHIGRVARIVRNLQTFARPARQCDEAVSVAELVAAARDLAAVPLGAVEVDTRVDPALSVQGDRGALEQVLVNLLANAGDAMDGSGRVEVTAWSEGPAVAIEVRDHGPGVPPELRSDLFTPFTSGAQRTGLGLAIAWSLVHEHGGQIALRDAPSGGAVFRVTLPAAVGASRSSSASPESAPPRAPRPGDLLLVDDDLGVADVLRDVGSELGFRVHVVHTAVDALRRLEREEFQAILIDVHLPGMSGRDLLDVLRERLPRAASRAILMSGMFLPPEAGVVYLQKPFGRGKLADAIRQVNA